MQQCDVFFRPESIFVCCSLQTVDGIWIGSDPVVKLPPNASPEVLGKATIEILGASRGGVPRPASPALPTKQFLKKVGFRSWKEFSRSAVNLIVSFDGTKVEIMPMEEL